MKVNESLEVLVLPMIFGDQVREINLSLVLDPERGATLVDAGLPGQESAILELARQAGITPQNIPRMILSHHDVDHIGSAAAIVAICGSKVLALSEEVDYIDGTKAPLKSPPPERLAQMPQLKLLLEGLRHLPVDERLHDRQRLDLAGGIRVVATPGHTIGHLSLYLEPSKTLICGDALTSDEGTLYGPNANATPDMEKAMESVRRLAELDVATIVCYHGGIVNKDANGQLRRIAIG